jgi:restriction system protein
MRGKYKGAGCALVVFALYFLDKPEELVPVMFIAISVIAINILGKRRTKKINLKRCQNISGCLETYKQHPTQFEWFVANIFKRQGFSRVIVTKATGDGGRDILMMYKKQKYSVEVKLYAPSNVVGRPLLQKLYGAAMEDHAIPVFVTTSSFSRDAISYAEKMGIWTIDGVELERMIKEAA